jgi:putative endonuclease
MPAGRPRSLQHIYRSSLLRLDPQRSTGAPAGDLCAPARSRAAGEARGGPDPRRALGRRGEDLAAAHFRALGFELIAHNQYRRFGELDLVVFDGHTLVFVEVKTCHVRGGSAGSRGYDAQTLGWPHKRQLRRQRQTAIAWLAEQGSSYPRASCRRLDVVMVLFDEHDRFVRLDHIEATWDGA